MHRRIEAILALVSVFVSLFLLMLSFADASALSPFIKLNDDQLRAALSLLAFTAICLSVASFYFQPGLTSAKAKEAVTRYSKAKNLLEQRMLKREEVTADYLAEFQNLYLAAEDIPMIPNDRFNKRRDKFLKSRT